MQGRGTLSYEELKQNKMDEALKAAGRAEEALMNSIKDDILRCDFVWVSRTNSPSLRPIETNDVYRWRLMIDSSGGIEMERLGHHLDWFEGYFSEDNGENQEIVVVIVVTKVI
jgi:hypothetical protein